MSRRGLGRLMTGFAAVSLSLLAACGEDPAGPQPVGELTADETAAMVEFVVGETLAGLEAGGVATSVGPAGLVASVRLGMANSGVPVTLNFSVEATQECPGGGELGIAGSIQGTIDDETASGTLSLAVTTSISSCMFTEEGTSFTVSTNPDLELRGDIAWQNDEPVGTQTFTYTGGLNWSTDDGRAGSCSFNVLIQQAQDGSVVESGTACGTTLGG